MPDIDKHIGKLLQMLQSPKASKRYEACEYLRVEPKIPHEAIIALQNALNDTDAEVAEAAQRALTLHLAPPAADPIDLDPSVGDAARRILDLHPAPEPAIPSVQLKSSRPQSPLSFVSLFLSIVGFLSSPWIWGNVLPKQTESYSNMDFLGFMDNLLFGSVIFSFCAIITGIISIKKASGRDLPAIASVILGSMGFLAGLFALYVIIFIGT